MGPLTVIYLLHDFHNSNSWIIRFFLWSLQLRIRQVWLLGLHVLTVNIIIIIIIRHKLDLDRPVLASSYSLFEGLQISYSSMWSVIQHWFWHPAVTVKVFMFFTFALLFTRFAYTCTHNRLVTHWRKTEFFALILSRLPGERCTLRGGTDKPRHSATVINRSLWRYIEGGGKSKYRIVGNFCLQTSIGVQWGWRYIRAWLCGLSTRLK